MKQRIIIWLLSLLVPSYTKEQKAMINKFKSIFRLYFEDEFSHDPHSILSFGITSLQYEFEGEILHVTVVLEKPGLLIGVGGKTISNLNSWLKRINTEVHIEESKLWNYLK